MSADGSKDAFEDGGGPCVVEEWTAFVRGRGVEQEGGWKFDCSAVILVSTCLTITATNFFSFVTGGQLTLVLSGLFFFFVLVFITLTNCF